MRETNYFCSKINLFENSTTSDTKIAVWREKQGVINRIAQDYRGAHFWRNGATAPSCCLAATGKTSGACGAGIPLGSSLTPAAYVAEAAASPAEAAGVGS